VQFHYLPDADDTESLPSLDVILDVEISSGRYIQPVEVQQGKQCFFISMMFL
jgi:hypothetical protein